MGFFSLLESASDRLVRAISPEAGNRRAAARVRYRMGERMRERMERIQARRDEERIYGSGHGGFQSAEQRRHDESWLKSNRSPQTNLEEAREEMLERADSAYKNYELGTAFVEGRAVRIVGTGATLDPNIQEAEGITEAQAEGWNDSLREAWQRQVERIGKGGQELWEIQQTIQRHWDRHGEFFILVGDVEDPLAPTSLKLEVIHPNRVETPPEESGNKLVRQGVKLKRVGKSFEVAGYYIRDTHPNDDYDVEETYTFYQATFPNGLKRVIHEFCETEAGMRRGFPRMQVGFSRLKNSEEYEEAELERNWANSCVTAFVRTDLTVGQATEGDVVDADGKRVRDMSAGQIQYLGLADDITTNNPSGAPNTFADYMKWQAMKFAAGAGTSYPVLMNDFGGMNYISGRLTKIADQETNSVAHLRQVKAVRQVYQHFVTRAATGPSAFFSPDPVLFRSSPWLFWAVRIVPPARASIDPAKEDRGDLLLVEASIKPASDLVEAKTGMPARDVYKRVARDRAMRRENGLEENMPQMGRDPQDEAVPTQAGDSNDEASDANTEG